MARAVQRARRCADLQQCFPPRRAICTGFRRQGLSAVGGGGGGGGGVGAGGDLYHVERQCRAARPAPRHVSGTWNTAMACKSMLRRYGQHWLEHGLLFP